MEKILIIGSSEEDVKRVDKHMGCQYPCRDVSYGSFDEYPSKPGEYKWIFAFLEHNFYDWPRWFYQDLSRQLKVDGYLVILGRPAFKTNHRLKKWLRAALWPLAARYKNFPARAKILGDSCLRDPPNYQLIEISERVAAVHFSSLLKDGSAKAAFPKARLVYRKIGLKKKTLSVHEDFKNIFGSWLTKGRLPFLAESLPVQRPDEIIAGRDRANVLVLSPHPDDELIGCGGTILKLAQSGAQVHVLQLSEGISCQALKGQSEAIRRSIRQVEAKEVAAKLNFKITCWKTSDSGEIENSPQTQKALVQMLSDVQPSLIFVPSSCDFHPEHRLTFELLRDCSGGLPQTTIIYEYPVWGLLEANAAFDVSDTVKKIQEMLYVYKTAMKAEDYVTRCQVLSSYYSQAILGKTGAVEVFRRVDICSL